MTIKSVAAATKVTGILSSVNTSKNTVTVAGTTYNMASTAWNDAATASAKYDATLYLDANGYVVYVKSGAAATTSDKAVAVLKSYQSLNKDGQIVYMIKGVTSNGETVEWEVEKVGNTAIDATTDVSANTVYTYADADDNGAYELTAADNVVTALGTSTASASKTVDLGSKTVAATAKSMTATDTAYFDSNVKFILVNDGKAVVRDGVQKVSASATMFATEVLKGGKYYITAVYVLAAAPSSAAATSDIVFVGAPNGTTSVLDKSDNKAKTFLTYEAYINGEEVANFYAATGNSKGFYYAKVDEDTGAYVLTGNAYAATEGKISVAADKAVTATAGNIITAGGNDYDLSNATIVDLYAGADISSVADIDTNKNLVKVYVMFDADTAAASYVYVVSAS